MYCFYCPFYGRVAGGFRVVTVEQLKSFIGKRVVVVNGKYEANVYTGIITAVDDQFTYMILDNGTPIHLGNEFMREVSLLFGPGGFGLGGGGFGGMGGGGFGI